jgi:hypothetical protein
MMIDITKDPVSEAALCIANSPSMNWMADNDPEECVEFMDQWKDIIRTAYAPREKAMQELYKAAVEALGPMSFRSDANYTRRCLIAAIGVASKELNQDPSDTL